ncbi:MAG TPA: hypothetical protein DCE41_10835 [Cytophagales bacterium]|nr:hypothetical protein [Cytophagales bacterium]HAA20965.1 hypothetical protein [Cytophagales bacterium]HAP62603.1 hypothetical protein [Cytophagales bacterium]
MGFEKITQISIDFNSIKEISIYKMDLEIKFNKQFQEAIIPSFSEMGFTFISNRNSQYDPPYFQRIQGNNHEVIGNIHLQYFNSQLSMELAFNIHVSSIEKIWLPFYKTLYVPTEAFRQEQLITMHSNANRLKEYPNGKHGNRWFRYKDRIEDERTNEGAERIAKTVTV